jgi:hypothetical protein
MKKVRFGALMLVMMLTLLFATTAGAVTDGELDGEGHPNTVLILMEVGGQPAFRCSGTLISPTVVLTAGHCTNNYPDEPYSGMRIFTESDVDNGDNNYPFGGGRNSVEAKSWAAHPLYETAPFFVHDVGVIVLKKPVRIAEYGALPTADQLDELATQRGLEDITFTSVGYGLQQITSHVSVTAERVRYVAYPHLVQINVPGFTGDFSMMLSNNHSTGGTCFGDSGGPNFLGDSNVVAG